MKIDDLSITLFAWNDIPPHSYLGRGPFDPAGQPNRTGELGLVTIRTDDGGACSPAARDVPGEAARVRQFRAAA